MQGLNSIAEIFNYQPPRKDTCPDLKDVEPEDHSFIVEGLAGILYKKSHEGIIVERHRSIKDDNEENRLPDFLIYNNSKDLTGLFEVKNGRNLGRSSRARIRKMQQISAEHDLNFDIGLYVSKDNPKQNRQIMSQIRRRAPDANLFNLTQLPYFFTIGGTETGKLAMDKEYFQSKFPDMAAPNFVKNVDDLFKYFNKKEFVNLEETTELLNKAPYQPNRDFKEEYNL